MSLIRLSEEEFESMFKPVENTDMDSGCYQFDNYDTKDKGFLQFMALHYPNHVWTRIDGDDGCIYSINGWHIVNRIDYVITEIPWLEANDYEVLEYAPG